MQPLLRVLAVVLAAAELVVAAPGPADGPSVIAVSESGIMHLDSSGALLAWRPEVSQWWQSWHVATNPRNGTVCWVNSPEDQSVAGVMRCAPVTNLNQTWDLPQPRGFSVSQVDAIAFDWVEENWYLTASRTNYVCCYMFHHCAKLGESGGNVRYFAAYDIPNRLLFRIATEEAGPYKLEVVNLDGSGIRDLPTNLTYPAGLAVDPATRQIFVMDQAPDRYRLVIFQLDYNGENKRLVTNLESSGFGVSWRRSLDVINGAGVAMFDDQKVISVFSSADGHKRDLVNGAVKGQTVPALVKVEKLLAVKLFSPETQPEVENQCTNANCPRLCIPTSVSGTAGSTCFCPKGEQLIDFGCRVEYPLYAVVTGGDKLQAVDMQTEEVATILSGLTNVSKVDFFRTGDEEFLLFWVDAGSLFSGRWTPGGTILDVRTLLKISEEHEVMEIAIDWVHRHLLWMEKDSTKSSSKQFTAILSSLDGSYQRSISNDYGKRKKAMFVFRSGREFGYAEDSWGNLEFETLNMTGSSQWGGLGAYGNRFLTSLPNEVAVDHSLNGLVWQERFFWVSAGDQSVEYASQTSMFGKTAHSRLLTHPSLADAGGLDVLDSRLFWTERSTGQLWTADSHTGGDVRPLPITTAGGSLRLLHPWRHPMPPADEIMCDEERTGCSHFCLTVFVDWAWAPGCLCPDNMELGYDGKTCQS